MASYTKVPYCAGEGSMVLSCDRAGPHPVQVKPDLPGAVIVVHGVNDVGTSFDAVEQGVCEGLSSRLGWQGGKAPYVAATYRNYDPATDADRLEDDPDAVFFKRKVADDTHSPVIPFYWGYAEVQGERHRTVNTQKVDRYGNRLDKDWSKGGGPFANATSTLADMWNSGAPSLLNLPDRLAQDPLRPVLEAPGRMYMVLAAQRLAALVGMIRDYGPQDTVSIVGHSQGCLVSLLAQAFLMETPGARPADTLILTHPPYSLEENAVEAMGLGHGGGQDPAMQAHYGVLRGQQTLKARLDTLVQIVAGVAAGGKPGWSEAELKRLREGGVHSARWQPTQDRDNRGKVYLYFCPEDMTVALRNVQGIGWQGVPYQISGNEVTRPGQEPGSRSRPTDPITRYPLKELGPRFLQRVFTAKRRTAGKGPAVPFKVGLAPQDFVLREEGEDDHAHVAESGAKMRASLPESDKDGRRMGLVPLSNEDRQKGLRWISGEALATPVQAEMHAGSLPATQPEGAFESVDGIDAAIAVTSRYGLVTLPGQTVDDPLPDAPGHKALPNTPMSEQQIGQVQEALNKGKAEGDRFKIERGTFLGAGKLLLIRKESPNEARLRHQHATSGRSFHGAIFGSRRNHAQVTAYDLAIGPGEAVSHPDFYRYLCAVADWRLKKPWPNEKARPGILTWQKLEETFALYWSDEDEARKAIIEGNCEYYSTGALPNVLPDITCRPRAVACETSLGSRSEVVKPGGQASTTTMTSAQRRELGDWADVRVADNGDAQQAGSRDSGPRA